MFAFPIGVMLDSFRLPTDAALDAAKALGASGIQMYAVAGDHTPDALTPEKRRELLKKVQAHGLVFSALCGDLGQGFGNREKNPALIEKSKRILDLAQDLGTDVVTTHIGVVPDTVDDTYRIMQQACNELAEYAQSVGAYFAVETGPEKAAMALRLNRSGVSSALFPISEPE